MGVASGCGEQEVGVASGSGWNLWVWLLGVVLRREIYHTTYPYSSCICTFLQQHPYFFVHLYIYTDREIIVSTRYRKSVPLNTPESSLCSQY